LEATCLRYAPDGFANRVVFSETVIGKMCSIVKDQDRIQKENLSPITDECPRAILVEAYNDVFVEQSTPAGFLRGLDQFHPKPDLLPFAMAKFLGQNATHATLGYLAEEAGLEFMSDLRKHPQLIERGLKAYIEEVGKGLCCEYGGGGEVLFSEHGFAENATLAVKRMLNPLLADPVARVTRDPVRKLGWEDRLIGAIRMAQKAGVKPVVLLEAARLALKKACHENHWDDPAWALQEICSDVAVSDQKKLCDLIL
jgi:mannitol-1-phosphate 5-dehydrogenase